MKAESTAKSELQLTAALDRLHQLLYTRGGIRPANAAVEELSKLLLLRLAASRHPNMTVEGYELSDLVDPECADNAASVGPWKAAFTAVTGLSDLRGRTPSGQTQPVWPADEPLRISRTDILAEALRVLTPLEFGPNSQTSLDPLGVAFDRFLQGRYDHAGGLGTYLTPASITQAMSLIGFALAGPIEDGLIGDPCCGTGRFLAAMMTQYASKHGRDKVLQWSTDHVVGADQSPASIAMARVNLLSYGVAHPNVFTVSDSITDSGMDLWRGSFRLILTNPPFGDGKYDDAAGIERTAFLFGQDRSRRKIDPALAFVARCVDLLADGGVAGIVLPDGVLDGPTLRRTFLHGGLFPPATVEGIVSLPTATFAPSGTVAKTSCLFIRRGDSARSRVFLARARHVGHVMKSGSPVSDPMGDDLPNISAEIGALIGGYESSPLESLLVAECEREALTSLDASSVDLGALDARAELTRLGGGACSEFLSVKKVKRIPLTGALPFVSVLHLDELGTVKWREAESNLPTTPGKSAQAGDLLVSLLNPAKFRATVVPLRYPQVQVSAEFGVFESKIDPYAALALLQHPLVRAQLAPMGRGTSSSRRRIDAEDVLGLVCAPFDANWEREVGRTVRHGLSSIDALSRSLGAAYAQLPTDGATA